MSIAFRMANTWYDFYPRPGDLDRVRRAIDQNLPPGTVLDWNALLSADEDRPQSDTVGSFRAFGAFFNTMLDVFGGQKTGGMERVEFIPVTLNSMAVDVVPSHWRLISAPLALSRAPQLFTDTWATRGQLAQRYEQDPDEDSLEARSAYALQLTLTALRRVVDQRLPAGVIYS